MEKAVEKFLRYVSFETTAGVEKENSCSNEKMLLLSEQLIKELVSLNPEEISINKFGTIDCKFSGNREKDRIAFLAHVDTSPQASGKDVKPRVLRYEGGIVPLGKKKLDPSVFPSLNRNIGHDIVVTDGTTLLGADDKAGIAIIMKALEEILQEEDHAPLEVIFTTDEEIGCDAKHITMDLVTSKYGYTVDGGDYRMISTESFNAYGMNVHVYGKSIHPGMAKNKMVNANYVLIQFDSLLPRALRPENTEGREPFYHLSDMRGSEDYAWAEYIVRSFDSYEIEKMIELAKKNAEMINEKLGYEAVILDIKQQYRNMKEVLDNHPEITEKLEKVYKEMGIPFEYEATRGGTTGSQLSFMGLPCVNIGTGGYNCHGKYEYEDVYEMDQMVEVVKRLMRG